MKRHLNTLFVTTQGAYVGKEGESIEVRFEGERRLRVPTISLDGIVCFGQVSASPAAMALCAESGIAMTFLTEHGKFLARVSGFTPGNVRLRREQYRRADDPAGSLAIARNGITAKIANCRTVLLRAVRDHPENTGRSELEAAAHRLAGDAVRARQGESVDALRGIEGDAAGTYFSVFNHLLVAQRDSFAFGERNRRPPTDPINSLLSFLYTMLAHDTRAACEATGLDAAVGFLHRDRPGRPSLALDLMEELRPILADRLALSLINRQQIEASGFTKTESGAVVMDDSTRRVVLTAYQERKQESLTHPVLGEKTTLGLAIYIQAQLLARHLRGDLDAYPGFIWR